MSEPAPTIADQVASRADAARIRDHMEALEILRKLAVPLTSPDAVEVIRQKLGQLHHIHQTHEWGIFAARADEIYIASLDTLNLAHGEAVKLRDTRVAVEARMDEIDRNPTVGQ